MSETPAGDGPPLTYARRVTEALRVRMIMHKVDRPALAKALGVNVSAVSRRMSKASWSLDDLEQIAPLFNLDPHELADPSRFA